MQSFYHALDCSCIGLRGSGCGPLPSRRLLLSEQVVLAGRQIPLPQIAAFRSQRDAKRTACDLSSGARGGSVCLPQ